MARLHPRSASRRRSLSTIGDYRPQVPAHLGQGRCRRWCACIPRSPWAGRASNSRPNTWPAPGTSRSSILVGWV